MSVPTTVRDSVLLVGRVVLGLVFVAHGLQKFDMGLGNVGGYFGSLGVPLPEAAAWVQALIEIVGGGALVLGALVPVVGAVLALSMLGALWFAHRAAGLYVTEGGYEFVLVLAAAAAVLAAVGGGRFAVDRFVFKQRAAA